jgi:hypothetical protein
MLPPNNRHFPTLKSWEMAGTGGNHFVSQDIFVLGDLGMAKTGRCRGEVFLERGGDRQQGAWERLCGASAAAGALWSLRDFQHLARGGINSPVFCC